MSSRENAIQLADQYELTDLEPDVDPTKAAAFLSVDEKPTGKSKKSRSKIQQEPPVVPPDSLPHVEPLRPEHWTSRTIRLRQSTAVALTMAACGQKSRQVETKLTPGEPVTVQEIADRGIRLALAELGYQT